MDNKERRLREFIKEGQKAEELMDFLNEFYEVEKGKVVIDLLRTTKPPELIRGDLRAAKRLVDYIKTIALRGKQARNVLNEKTEE